MPGVKGRSGGRNAKTPQAHTLAGTFEKKRHTGYLGPDPPKGIPRPPKPLTGEAGEEWARMITRLTLSQTLAQVDDGVLYQYCRLFAETEAIAGTQGETAATIAILEENLHGAERADLLAVCQEIAKLRQLEARYTNQIRQGRMALRAYLVEFGLTPASRGRVKLPTATAEVDPFDEFDKGTLQ